MRGTSRRRRKRSGGTRRRRGKKEQFTGDVKRSERRIFGNEVSSQRSQSRRRVTGRLIGVNRRGDESAITFLSTRIHSLSLSLSHFSVLYGSRWKLGRREWSGPRVCRRQNPGQLYRGNALRCRTSRYLSSPPCSFAHRCTTRGRPLTSPN